MNILIIGGGNMGFTFAKSILKAKITNPESLMILETNKERAEFLQQQNLGVIFQEGDECVPKADLVILAVKPQNTAELFKGIRPLLENEQLILSIMAGVSIEQIQEALGIKKVIRSMPNLPAQIGMGMTVFSSSKETTRIELVAVQNLLNTTGKAIYVSDEDKINASTAISGSGPAYVFYFMNAMIEAAREMGFSPSEATLLVNQTFKGSVQLINRNDLSCGEWIEKVASKGGTTEAALFSFDKQQVASHIQEGAKQAFKRAVELGTRFKK